MTAIQIDNNVTDIMHLPCVKECHKERNGRYSFVLWDGTAVKEGDWIIDAESADAAFVLSDENYKKVRSTCRDFDIPVVQKTLDEVCTDLNPKKYSDIVNETIFGDAKKYPEPEFKVGDLIQYITDSAHVEKIAEVDMKGGNYVFESGAILLFENQDNWIRKRSPETPGDLSEFEEEIRHVVTETLTYTSEDGSFSTTVFITEKTAKVLAGKLLSIARRQIAGEIDIDAMAKKHIDQSVVIDSMNDADVYDAMVGMRNLIESSYRTGMEDAIITMFKAEGYEWNEQE